MKTKFIQLLALVTGAAILVAGCKPAAKPSEAAREPKEATSTAAPARVQYTFSDLPVPPEPKATPDLIARGKAVYAENCVACHGVNGDGQGPAAAFLVPRPRNFVKANYKLRTTPMGSLPTDDDLFRAVSLGVPGTPMPPWKVNLNDEDRWAVVAYIKTFSPRFADTNENRTVVDLGTPPPHNAETVAEGKAFFTKFACVTCHGETGQGNGTAAINLVDDDHLSIKPRNFTRPAEFKSGYAAKEIVRTMLTGFNGTPMVGFKGTIPPEDAWKLAYYIETFAKPAAPAAIVRASHSFMPHEQLGEPDVRIKLIERAWKYVPNLIRVKKGQVVQVTFEPTDNGLGAGHGFAISGYDEVAFLNGAMVGAPKTVKFRADHAGKFTFYCATQCSTEKLHPLMNGTFIVEDNSPKQTASAN